jgi:hypothetical protein
MTLPRRALTLVAACTVALAGCADFPEEKLRCEEAVANLLHCCPTVTTSPVACEYTNNGWGFPLTLYYFPKVECLIGLSCADLTARGACTWAADPAHAPAVCQ